MNTPQSSYPIGRGLPAPFGASQLEDGINFALFSKEAEKVSLCLYSSHGAPPFFETALDPHVHKTGDIWHVCIRLLPPTFSWGYKILCQGKTTLASDPYAKSLNTPSNWGSTFYATETPLGYWQPKSHFDWEKGGHPLIPFKDLVIYEMHVRAFTQDPSARVKHPGTFAGLQEKIPYLKELGINAVELLPIFEFDECENALKNPKTGKNLYNLWGYSTVNFFSLMNRYAATSDPISEFKALVKELHRNKIEVILDVVYNHTAEGNASGRTFSFKGIDKGTYYILGPEGNYLNFSGCGNTFNCNEPVTMELILDSLRYWVTEMHVDGFRFDLASILTRNPQGHPLADPPLIEAIAGDPLLANCKLIAEAWDAAGLYQVGSFPRCGRFSEWNGKYRDTVRRFIKGTDNQSGFFSQSICGSEYLYGHTNSPCTSINFVTAHDGFSLYDLVSYNQKHNEENGENNQDGANDNESWNCGKEGVTSNPKTLLFRERQMRNFHTALMVSLGVPMVLMGDEYGHTRLGNNNAWSQDNAMNWFQWDALVKKEGFHRFFKKLISFRKMESIFKRDSFLVEGDVDWHGTSPFKPNWGPGNHFVAYTLKDKIKENHLYIAFNAQEARISTQLPEAPAHKKWYRIVDTALSSPNDFIDEPEKFAPIKATYKMEGYSAIIIKAL